MSLNGCLQVFIFALTLNTVRSIDDYFADIQLNQTAFLLCNMQEYFQKNVENFDLVVKTSNRMLSAAHILGIPVFASTLDQKIYGKPVQSVKLGKSFCYERQSLSMYTPVLKAQIEKLKKIIKSFVIFGNEIHIDIEQTVIDLLEAGYQVHIVTDGVSARSFFDRTVALCRLPNIGATLGTSESILYKFVRKTSDDNYLKIVKLSKRPLPPSFEDA